MTNQFRRANDLIPDDMVLISRQSGIRETDGEVTLHLSIAAGAGRHFSIDIPAKFESASVFARSDIAEALSQISRWLARGSGGVAAAYEEPAERCDGELDRMRP
jgi:hypothetical protein